MISSKTATSLKEAGLLWKPATHDFFAVPGTELSDQVFALSDMTVALDVLHGQQAITFNGAVEWALDFVFKMEALWIPNETQLRNEILERLEEPSSFHLQLKPAGFLCTIRHKDQLTHFEADSAEEAYAAALLWLLRVTSDK